MNYIDALLNRITMYRLVIYALVTYTALGIGAAFLGRITVSPTSLVFSLVMLLVPAYVTDRALAHYLDVTSNRESWLITGLILFLIVHPASSIATGITLALAGAVSGASKYLIALNGKHLFNPAALAAALLSLTGLQSVTWWVGSSFFWPFTLLLGLAVVRKIRRFPLFLAFVVTTIVLSLAQFIMDGQPVVSNLQSALLSSPLIFLSTIMLTEPATMPPRRNGQLVFGVLVAALYVAAPKFGPLTVYPEVALLLGNLYAYLVSPKFSVRLRLKEIQRASDWVCNYIFVPDRPFRFQPGQYMEWTLPKVPYDSRGNRRTFTIASSPTEQEVCLGIKFYEPASQYKATLSQLRPGDVVYANQLAGNFTLDQGQRKLLFIAGGIGITPFRSMVKYLTDTNTPRDIVLLYLVADPRELMYQSVLQAAAHLGVRTIPVVTKPGYAQPGVVSGQLSSELLSHLVPDLSGRLCYISGPAGMVDAAKAYLLELGVTGSQVKTDHFSGY